MRLLIALLTLVSLSLATTLPARAETAADWMLVSAQGEEVRLSEEVQQQPVVLCFWATWCPYCKALMPPLQSIRLEYGHDVEILAVNFRENKDPVAFIRDAGYDFTVLPNGDDVAALYEIYGTPGIIIVDSKQQIRFDLRDVVNQKPPTSAKTTGHKAMAAYRAPFWAAEIRRALDTVLGSYAVRGQCLHTQEIPED